MTILLALNQGSGVMGLHQQDKYKNHTNNREKSTTMHSQNALQNRNSNETNIYNAFNCKKN